MEKSTVYVYTHPFSSEAHMLIGEIQKNSTERIRVSIEEYKGYSFLDVRVYYEDDQGEWRPTKKGIAVPPDKVRDLIELLRKGTKKQSSQ